MGILTSFKPPGVGGGSVFDPVSIGLGALGGLFGFFGQSSANQANKDIAREQMQFQKIMSDTAYQRSMRDMKLAGLNPMLAFSQGGASTPTGASAHMESTTKDVGDSIKMAAVDRQRLLNEMKETQSRIDLNEASKFKQMADADLAMTNASIGKAGLPAAIAIGKYDEKNASFISAQKAYRSVVGSVAGALTNAHTVQKAKEISDKFHKVISVPKKTAPVFEKYWDSR